MTHIHTDRAPAAIGPYSQAVSQGSLVFTSGQIPLDAVSGKLAGTSIEEQAEQVMKNLLAVLDAAGSGPEMIIKTTCFLADMEDFAAFNAIYSKYIQSNPARSCFAVRDLPMAVRVEVEAVAYCRKRE